MSDIVEAVARFADRIDFSGANGCHLWTGSLDQGGYGLLYAGRGRSNRAHRVIYEDAIGPIAPGLVIDHICRVRNCVNPEHLRVITRGENTLCGVGPTAVNARLTHCRRGHAFTPENLYVSKAGFRTCRTCQRATNLATKARRRAERSAAIEEKNTRADRILARLMGPGGHYEIRGTGRGYRVWVPLQNLRSGK